jgi:hypothetical protein
MVELTNSLRLSGEMRRLLEGLAQAGLANPLYQSREEEAFRAVYGVIEPLVRYAGLDGQARALYRWFARDLARTMAEFQGRILAHELLAVLQKWQRYGCELKTMQLLLCEVWRAILPEETDGRFEPELD